ncbi:hypothetical protein M0804_015285 [Polistes exclamans]|nr:hypothetical protein M0804_015287 [Polistes exclamans]KAI4473563.1 hypothetical protein M0804_015285 [Polistes exclamans]
MTVVRNVCPPILHTETNKKCERERETFAIHRDALQQRPRSSPGVMVKKKWKGSKEKEQEQEEQEDEEIKEIKK